MRSTSGVHVPYFVARTLQADIYPETKVTLLSLRGCRLTFSPPTSIDGAQLTTLLTDLTASAKVATLVL